MSTRQRMNYSPGAPLIKDGVHATVVERPSVANKAPGGYPPEVSKFTKLLYKQAHAQGMSVRLDSNTPYRDDAKASSVRYCWESQNCTDPDIEKIAKDIFSATLCHADWGDSITVQSVEMNGLDECRMHVRIRIGKSIWRWYALKVAILSILLVGLCFAWLFLMHILWHVIE